ncbi:MAG: SpoIIE family protein phosphatase [Bacteroidales bacterium]|jgi:serine phosphatase RsbU (regulator of sigma subunit)/ligand-binding sensor domain-containing protein
MRIRYLFVFFLFISHCIWAQNYDPTEWYTINQGLSHNEITSLYADKKGFLWVGTADGLNRYDGYTFKRYIADIEDPRAIPNDHIYKIQQDKGNNIWCATGGGLFKLALSENSFAFFNQYTDTFLFSSFSPVYDFVIDTTENRIFFLSSHFFGITDIASGYIERYPIEYNSMMPDYVREYSIDAEDQDILLASGEKVYCYSIEHDSLAELFPSFSGQFRVDGGIKGLVYGIHKKIWIYTRSNIWQTGSGRELSKLSLPDHIMDRNNILSLEQNSDTTLEIFTSRGVFLFNFIRPAILSSVTYNIPMIPEHMASSGIRDRSGVYWLGTTKGLLRFNHHGKVLKHFRVSDFYKKTVNEIITSAVYDSNGKLWLGFNSGTVLILDTKATDPSKAVLFTFRNSSKINSLAGSRSGNIYVCSDKGLTEYAVPDNDVYTRNTVRPEFRRTGEEVYTVREESRDIMWVSQKDKVLLLENNTENEEDQSDPLEISLPDPCFDILRAGKYIYFLQSNRVMQLDLENRDITSIHLSDSASNKIPEIHAIMDLQNDKVLLGSSEGLYEYNVLKHVVSPFKIDSATINTCVNSLIEDNERTIWLSTSGNIISINKTGDNIKYLDKYDGLDQSVFSVRGAAKADDGEILFFGRDRFVTFRPVQLIKNDRIPCIEFTNAILRGKKETSTYCLIGADSLIVDPEFRNIRINFTALDFWNPDKNKYRYSFERNGKNDKWQFLGNRNHIEFYGPRTGIYSLKIMGSNSDNVWNPVPRELIVQIKAPIWKSRIAIVIYMVFIFVLFYFSVYFKTRQLRKINKEYREREHIGKKIEMQKEELSVKNKNITDSINYAKRIQMALMPSQRLFSQLFPDSFILHLPKDIVSGDFYWINEVGDRIYFAAVDCTGHGVPGAFMSVIGFELFRRITETEKKKQPAEILNSLSRGFESVFSDVDNVVLRDGMDVAFCAIDHEMKVLEFAGAFNPLYLVRDNTITEIKGDRFSVGVNDEGHDRSFSNHVIPLAEGDVMYIFTDGFADQFGGPEGKKYKYRRFRHLLLALHQLPMRRQREFLKRSILDWKGSLDQVDDILVLGIKIGKSFPVSASPS